MAMKKDLSRQQVSDARTLLPLVRLNLRMLMYMMMSLEETNQYTSSNNTVWKGWRSDLSTDPPAPLRVSIPSLKQNLCLQNINGKQCQYLLLAHVGRTLNAASSGLHHLQARPRSGQKRRK